MVELTNTIHFTYGTTPDLIYSLIIPSCLICEGEGRVVIEFINESYRQVVLKQLHLLTQAIELNEILTTDTESHKNVIVRHYGVDNDRNLPSWEEGNKIHNEMSATASFIPDDSLEGNTFQQNAKK